MKSLNLRIVIAMLLLASGGLIQGCYYDVEEELYPPSDVQCDTTGVTYSQSIVPVLNSNCITCHSQANAQGQVILDNYADVKTNADNGKLLGAIRWDDGFAQMPQGGNKLSDCTIKQFETWVNAGAPNN
jgi:hypothetical protein